MAHGLWWIVAVFGARLCPELFALRRDATSLSFTARYVVAPLFTSLTTLVWIGPGFLLERSLWRTREATPLLALRSAGCSAAIFMLLASLTKWILGAPAPAFAEMGLITAVTAAMLLLARRSTVMAESVTTADRRAFLIAAALQVLAAAWLAPAVFVRELSSDGIESLEMGLSLAEFHLPRNPSESGLVGVGVGMIAQAFPAHFFSLVLGPLEAAPRLPLLLFLPFLHLGVVGLAGRATAGRLPSLANAGVAAALLSVVAVLGLNASFDPYFSDLASPAALDAMTLTMILGILAANEERDWPRLLSFGALAHFCRPSGMLILLFLTAATFLTARGARIRSCLRLVLAIAACAILTWLYERVYVPRVGGGLGLPAGSVLSRLRYVCFTDWRRLAFVVLPAGVVTIPALFLHRRMDAPTRALAWVSLAWVAFFYFPGNYAPHHFAPAMVLPVIVYWRLAAGAATAAVRARLAAIGVMGALAGLWLCLPAHDSVPQPFRDAGAAVSVPAGGPRLGSDLAPFAVLSSVVSPPWSGADPHATLVGSPLQVAHYARLLGPRPDDPSWTYRVQRSDAARAPGAVVLEERPPWVLLARDASVVRPGAVGHLATDFQRPWLVVPPERLVRGILEKRHAYDVDIRALVGRR